MFKYLVTCDHGNDKTVEAGFEDWADCQDFAMRKAIAGSAGSPTFVMVSGFSGRDDLLGDYTVLADWNDCDGWHKHPAYDRYAVAPESPAANNFHHV